MCDCVSECYLVHLLNTLCYDFQLVMLEIQLIAEQEVREIIVALNLVISTYICTIQHPTVMVQDCNLTT